MQGGNTKMLKECSESIKSFIDQWITLKINENGRQLKPLQTFLSDSYDFSINQTIENINKHQKDIGIIENLISDISYTGDEINFAEVLLTEKLTDCNMKLNIEKYRLQVFQLCKVSSSYYTSPINEYLTIRQNSWTMRFY